VPPVTRMSDVMAPPHPVGPVSQARSGSPASRAGNSAVIEVTQREGWM
jgi:hypothetical protein